MSAIRPENDIGFLKGEKLVEISFHVGGAIAFTFISRYIIICMSRLSVVSPGDDGLHEKDIYENMRGLYDLLGSEISDAIVIPGHHLLLSFGQRKIKLSLLDEDRNEVEAVHLKANGDLWVW